VAAPALAVEFAEPVTVAPRAVIELRDVTKVYSTGGDVEVKALRGIDLAVRSGEYVAVVGASGSGKSTLMHIIGCLDTASTGTYLLAGEDVSALDDRDLAEIRNERIGFVFQQFFLLPSLSAWRNVELPLIYAGVHRRERKARTLAALQRVGLEDRVNHKPSQLSGGQQQRVAIARALVGEPTLILADEPTGNLDSTATEDILALFDELIEQGSTVVVITHEAEVAERARRIIRIRDGLIVDDGGSTTSGITHQVIEPPSDRPAGRPSAAGEGAGRPDAPRRVVFVPPREALDAHGQLLTHPGPATEDSPARDAEQSSEPGQPR
jgi:putative ABC transport system ATP-binding protein